MNRLISLAMAWALAAASFAQQPPPKKPQPPDSTHTKDRADTLHTKHTVPMSPDKTPDHRRDTTRTNPPRKVPPTMRDTTRTKPPGK